MTLFLDGQLGISASSGAAAAQQVSFPDGTQFNTAQSLGPRNRIINGAMAIDQRNVGASISVNNTSTFSVDRFFVQNNYSNTVTAQQVTAVPNSTFSYSVKLTNGTSISTFNTQLLWQHRIEGYNIADLGYGTSAAQYCTLSFWVQSSVTGLYGGSLNNSPQSYVFTYNINVANTWQYVTITIPPNVANAFGNTTNGVGMYVVWDLGSGPAFETPAGSWTTGDYKRTSSCIHWNATAGATLYITGVQLEIGTVATPFERRLYGTELQLCQRYYENISNGITTYNATSSAAKASVNMFVPKRGTMSIGLISGTTWYFQTMASTFASGSNGYVGTGINTGPTSITQYGGSVINSQTILFDLVAPSTLPTGMGYMFFGSNNLNSALTGVGMYVSSEL